jgi:hypothetical protein
MARRIVYKSIGEEWFSMVPPEELHYWIKKYPWSVKDFKQYETSLVSVAVKSIEPLGKSSTQKHTIRYPLHLPKTGVDITGRVSTSAPTKKASFTIRVDGVVKFNHIMKELSTIYQMKTWRVLRIEAYNIKKGVALYYKVFKPNGVNKTLALYKIFSDAKETKYSNLTFGEISCAVGKFKKELIACTMLPPTAPANPEVACAVANRHKINQLKSKENIIRA